MSKMLQAFNESSLVSLYGVVVCNLSVVPLGNTQTNSGDGMKRH